MIRNYYNEKWKDVVFDDDISENMTFKISNYGRLIKVVDGKDILIEKQYFEEEDYSLHGKAPGAVLDCEASKLVLWNGNPCCQQVP